MQHQKTDFIIIGAGIVGLSIAKALIEKHPDQTIIILDKEETLATHASGRNSGVLHSGIYYPSNSLKLKFCVEGAAKLRTYCQKHQLPFQETGKVILPISEQDTPVLEKLYQQAQASNIKTERLNEQELKTLEPDIKSATDEALFLPNTASFNPTAIIKHLKKQLEKQGVTFILGEAVTSIQEDRQTVKTKSQTLGYGKLINAAGAFADKIAHQCNVGKCYRLLPFKGTYYRLNPKTLLNISHHIYPVPDLNMPFLGVHFTINTDELITIGPSAIPAFGPENYQGLSGIQPLEIPDILWSLSKQYLKNQKGFRNYTHQEASRLLKYRFVQSAKALVPKIKSSDLLPSSKVGIRAQLYDKNENTLVMDFLIEQGKHSIHILNAVSPAFTCGLSFGEWVTEKYIN